MEDLNLSSNIILNSTVTNEGNLNFSTNSLINGTINLEDSSNSTGNINLTTNSMLNLNNPTTYGSVNGQTAGDGVINSNTTQTTKAEIGTSTAVGILNVKSGVLTLGADATVNQTNIDSGTSLNLKNYDITGSILNNGTLNINGSGLINGNVSGNGLIDIYNSYNSNGSLSSSNINVRPSSTLILNNTATSISGTTTLSGHNAKIISNESLTINTININTNNNYYDFGINKINTMIDATNGSLNVTSINGPQDTDLVYFTTTTVSDANSTNKVEVVMNYRDTLDSNLNENNLNTYLAVKNIIYNNKVIFDEINSLSINGIKKSLSTMNPESQGVSELSVNIVTNSLNIISSHLSSLSGTKLKTGISTGDNSLNNMVWGKTYYTKLSQDDRGTISGYDGTGYGFIAGFDRVVSDNKTYGVALGFSKGNINSKNTLTDAQTDTTSVQASIYLTQNYRNFQFEEMLLYSHNMNKASRKVVIGSIISDANADYDSKQLSFRLGVSYPFYSENLYVITPKTSLTYSYLKTDSYTETGTAATLLNVNTKDYVKYTPKINIELKKDFETKYGLFSPYINLGYGYELGDEFTVTNSTFQGSGSSFETVLLNGSKSLFEAGVGAMYLSNDGLKEFSFNINSVLKDGYSEYTGMFSSKIKF